MSLCSNSAPAPCSAHLQVSMLLNQQCPPQGRLYKALKNRVATDQRVENPIVGRPEIHACGRGAPSAQVECKCLRTL